MPKTKAKAEADARYNKKTYEQIAFVVRYDAELNGEAIRNHAASMGETMNSFIKRAVTETVARDKQRLTQS